MLKLKYIAISLCAVLSVCVSVHAYEWTDWTSEEREPRVCDFDKFQSGFRCSGGYCDNIKLECHNPGINGITDRYWSAQISEEHGGSRFCRWNYFVAGISTSGRYSDNISLECVTAPNVSRNHCRWSNWKSEEGGGTELFFPGYYAVGVQCSGKYCDNKRFRICRTRD